VIELNDDVEIRQIRRLKYVDRWSVIPTIRRQSVADHSFHVIWIATWLAQKTNQYDNSLASEILLHGITHDKSESYTGDIPSPAKRSGRVTEVLPFPLHLISELAEEVCGVADIVEAVISCNEEIGMGNAAMAPVKEGLLNTLTSCVDSCEHWTGTIHDVGDLLKIVNVATHPSMEIL